MIKRWLKEEKQLPRKEKVSQLGGLFLKGPRKKEKNNFQVINIFLLKESIMFKAKGD